MAGVNNCHCLDFLRRSLEYSKSIELQIESKFLEVEADFHFEGKRARNIVWDKRKVEGGDIVNKFRTC